MSIHCERFLRGNPASGLTALTITGSLCELPNAHLVTTLSTVGKDPPAGFQPR